MDKLRGIFTPLVTPVEADGAPDLVSVRRLASHQMEAGVDGLWAMGTSSEFAAFSTAERASMVEAVVAAAGGAPVIANISDAGTRRAIEHGRRAAEAGAQAVAATPPYYYPHTQDEVLAHYRAIRESVDRPLFVYNIPQTVRIRVELPTLLTLIDEGTVVGMKDSQNDLEYVRQVAMHVGRAGTGFSLFAGTRYLIDAAVLVGAQGAIPSIANAFPRLCIEAFERATAGDFPGSAAICARIAALENLAKTSAGSRNAALLGFLKAVLRDEGIISFRLLSPPLRNLSEAEVGEILQGVAWLESLSPA